MANRYALILNSLVENVILADSTPQIAGRVAVLLSAAQAVSPGDSYDGTAFTPYQPTAAEIERRDAPAQLRAVIGALATWADDAQALATWADDAQALADLPAGSNVSQAQIKALFGRFGLLSKIVRRLLIVQGLDQ